MDAVHHDRYILFFLCKRFKKLHACLIIINCIENAEKLQPK